VAADKELGSAGAVVEIGSAQLAVREIVTP
jgi:hypothetical protein